MSPDVTTFDLNSSRLLVLANTYWTIENTLLNTTYSMWYISDNTLLLDGILEYQWGVFDTAVSPGRRTSVA